MLTRVRRAAAVALLAAGCVLALAVPASAGEDPPGNVDAGAGPNAGGWDTFAAANHVRLSGSGYRGGTGNVGGSAGISPPPCWYGPSFDSAGAKAYLEGQILPTSTNGGSIGYDWGEKVRKLLQEPSKGTAYHAGEEGYWYGQMCAYDTDPAVSEAFYTNAANPIFVWVGPGYPPVPGPTITARMLAEIARAHLTAPTIPVSSSPDTAAGLPSTVALATWLWAAPQAVDVTAAIPGLASTVTATLVGLRVTDLPAAARAHPGGGDCGGLGAAYRGGDGEPPCGVTFGRAAASVTVGLEAVWRITWAATNGEGGVLDTAAIGQTLAFAVQEVQVLNGGSRWADLPG